MFQELEFHMPRVQTSSYHIYKRDSAGDEDLRLGSETEILYLLICTCSSVIVGPPKNPLHLWFRRVFGEPFPPGPYRYIHQLDWVPKTLPIFIQYRGIWLSRSEWFGSCQASSSVLLYLYNLSYTPAMQSIRAFFGSFCLYHKYGDSAANTTIKCWKIGPWNNKIFIVPAPKGLIFNWLGPKIPSPPEQLEQCFCALYLVISHFLYWS